MPEGPASSSYGSRLTRGLLNDGSHLTWERNYYDQPANLQLAWPIRNLTAAQAIEAVWRGVTAP